MKVIELQFSAVSRPSHTSKYRDLPRGLLCRCASTYWHGQINGAQWRAGSIALTSALPRRTSRPQRAKYRNSTCSPRSWCAVFDRGFGADFGGNGNCVCLNKCAKCWGKISYMVRWWWWMHEVRILWWCYLPHLFSLSSKPQCSLITHIKPLSIRTIINLETNTLHTQRRPPDRKQTHVWELKSRSRAACTRHSNVHNSHRTAGHCRRWALGDCSQSARRIGTDTGRPAYGAAFREYRPPRRSSRADVAGTLCPSTASSAGTVVRREPVCEISVGYTCIWSMLTDAACEYVNCTHS